MSEYRYFERDLYLGNRCIYSENKLSISHAEKECKYSVHFENGFVRISEEQGQPQFWEGRKWIKRCKFANG